MGLPSEQIREKYPQLQVSLDLMPDGQMLPERAEAIGGRMSIRSQPEKGTLIQITAPLDRFMEVGQG